MLRHSRPSCIGAEIAARGAWAIYEGHTYLTTVLDLETGRMVWIGPERTKATLLRFFAELTRE